MPVRGRRPPVPLDLNGLMAYAARILSAWAKTVSELREKLKKRAAQPDDVTEALRRIKEAGYLNDEKFAGSFASWRRDNEGLGKTRVLQDRWHVKWRPPSPRKPSTRFIPEPTRSP